MYKKRKYNKNKKRRTRKNERKTKLEKKKKQSRHIRNKKKIREFISFRARAGFLPFSIYIHGQQSIHSHAYIWL